MDLRLLSHLAQGYHGFTQIARVLTEEWVAREGYCVSCLHTPLERLPNNEAVWDFRCTACQEPYQLKARASSFGKMVADGAYSTFYDAVLKGDAPNFLLMHYDRGHHLVLDLFGVHRRFISPLAVIRRNPLGPSARRAGWVGCNVSLGAIPRGALIPIIESGNVLDRESVRRQWGKYARLASLDNHSGWLRDVLSCVLKLGSDEFRLADIYSYAVELGELHPRNRNVEPKIRQQLQVLCREGLVERLAPGLYRRSGST
ncbi:MAG: restriction endonuclease [Euryarchaeota archaeon]|nr:restriction endonuclease [Euryarchaeota archaeon]MDE1836015.1 restriction endonuclease [Euryarchaeota archaeon]MDE1881611.1 restriction endonuclease [Euryarchaeota archaeon]MDE2045993.1 restriction endonuclease [Thermoplasmata archaeon]